MSKPPHMPPTDPPVPGEADANLEAEADAEPTPEELARAASLARLMDRLLAGSPPPPALPAEDRVLLEAATMIHSAHVQAELGARQVNALVADALGGDRGRVLAFPEKLEVPAEVIDLRRGSRRRRLLVATVFAVCAAAAAVWFVISARPQRQTLAAPSLPAMMRSRSAGALLGAPIQSSAAGDASARLDLVFADRLAGYRELVYRQRAQVTAAAQAEQASLAERASGVVATAPGVSP